MGRTTLWNDKFWDEVFDKDFLLKNSKTSNVFPLYNMYKENDEYYLEFAVAGYSPNDIGISVDNNELVIEAEKVEHEGRTYIDKHITSKAFRRKFSLNTDVDVSKISAKFKDGMLIIHLPLLEEKKPKSRVISIEAA
jgi:molecular chaperone IbpA